MTRLSSQTGPTIPPRHRRSRWVSALLLLWLERLGRRPRLAQLSRARARYRDRPGQLAVCLAMVPVAPLGLGVSDSLGEELYAGFSITEGAEVTMLVRAIVVGWCVLGAVGFLIPLTRGGDNPSVSVAPKTEDP